MVMPLVSSSELLQTKTSIQNRVGCYTGHGNRAST